MISDSMSAMICSEASRKFFLRSRVRLACILFRSRRRRRRSCGVHLFRPRARLAFSCGLVPSPAPTRIPSAMPIPLKAWFDAASSNESLHIIAEGIIPFACCSSSLKPTSTPAVYLSSTICLSALLSIFNSVMRCCRAELSAFLRSLVLRACIRLRSLR